MLAPGWMSMPVREWAYSVHQCAAPSCAFAVANGARPVDGDGIQPGIAGHHLVGASGGRSQLKGQLDVLFQKSAQLGRAARVRVVMLWRAASRRPCSGDFGAEAVQPKKINSSSRRSRSPSTSATARAQPRAKFRPACACVGFPAGSPTADPPPRSPPRRRRHRACERRHPRPALLEDALSQGLVGLLGGVP